MANYYGGYGYPQNYYPQAMQAPQMPQPQPQQIPTAVPQIQNGGFVSVRTEDEARNYPVAQGMSVTFKNETAPYIYTKTMGFSQLDRPIFERYKLVKEQDMPVEAPKSPDKPEIDVEAINVSINNLKAEMGQIWGEIDGLKELARSKPATKKEKGGDD